MESLHTSWLEQFSAEEPLATSPESSTSLSSSSPKPGKAKSKGLFIKGPVPFDWMAAANALPGKAGAVGLALWFLRGLSGNDTIQLTREVQQLASCCRKALYVGLSSLEEGGLITVVRRKSGSRAIVRILPLASGQTSA